MIKELQLYYFEGLDESILKLNDYIFDDGFKFVRYSLNEFEERFFYLFTVEGETINDTSTHFLNALINSKHFNADEIFRKNEYVIFLIDIFWNGYKTGNADDRLNKLIQKLKLFKHGHIKLISSFDVSEKEEQWHFGIPIAYTSPSKEEDTYSKYSLNDIDPSELKYFKTKLEIPSYLDLAFNSFLESYNIKDEKLKFTVLMISLESIFNIDQTPIKHTISRHTALIITRDKKSFDEEFKKIKTLYDLRSSIVHGNDKKFKKSFKDFKSNVSKLEEIVRSVLTKLLWTDKYLKKVKDKEELFDLLNASSPMPGINSN